MTALDIYTSKHYEDFLVTYNGLNLFRAMDSLQLRYTWLYVCKYLRRMPGADLDFDRVGLSVESPMNETFCHPTDSHPGRKRHEGRLQIFSTEP